MPQQTLQGQETLPGYAPSGLTRAALYSGPPNGNELYLYGGITSYINTSFESFREQRPTEDYTLSFDPDQNSYLVIHGSTPQLQRPSDGAYAEAPDQGLAFYFDGQVDNGSAPMATARTNFHSFLPGIIVLDTITLTAQNMPTVALASNSARAGAQLQYLPGIGTKGVLVLLGGGSKPIGNMSDDDIGTMSLLSEVSILDVTSLSKMGDGIWCTQNTSGRMPLLCVDFCVVAATTRDKSSYNIYLHGGRNATATYGDTWAPSLP